jgi:hypothetical protein
LRWWLWWLREEQLLRSRAYLLRSRPHLCRSRELLRSGPDVCRSRGELLQFRLQSLELLQIAVPQDEVPPHEVLPQVELLRSGCELLRSGPDLCCSDVRCPDLRCSDGFRLQLV